MVERPRTNGSVCTIGLVGGVGRGEKARLARYTLEAELHPGDTMDISGVAPETSQKLVQFLSRN